MDIKIGDILRTKQNKKGFKVLGNGMSYGYDLLNLKTNKIMYDIIVRKNNETSQYYNIDTRYCGINYRLGNRKQFNNGEYGTLIKKNANGTISIEFDNGKVLKFNTIHAWHNSWATSDREEGKEYEINVGDTFIFNKFIKGIVTDVELGQPKYTVNIGGKLIVLDYSKTIHIERLKIHKIKHVLLGEKMTYDDGVVGTIEDVENMTNILVSFSNGENKIISYERFKNSKPIEFERNSAVTCCKIIEGVTRVYQKNIQMYATVKRRLGHDKFEVVFEDGATDIVSRASFRKGVITRNRPKPVPITIGEKVKQNNGRIAEVIKIHKGRLIDVKFGDGEVQKNVSGGNFRKGSITGGLTESRNYSISQKYKNVPTVCGLYFSIVDFTDTSVVVEWNGTYKEEVDRRYYSMIQTPKGFTYIKKENKLYYKNIEITKYTLFKDDILIKGVCSVCKKPIKAYISEMKLGHNCLEDGTDYFGLKINVKHKGVNKYKITYLDGYSYEIEHLKVWNKDNKVTVLYKGLKNVRGNGVYLSGGVRTKVLDMYFDESIKRYRAVVQSGRGTQEKKRLVVLD